MTTISLEQFKKRKLDKCFFNLICISHTINFIDKNGILCTREVYFFFGCNLQGVRKYIDSCIIDDNSTSMWYDFFQSLKNSLIEEILFANIPNNKQLKSALLLSFPNIDIIFSFQDAINIVSKYFTINYSTPVFKHIKNIFLAKDINNFEFILEQFYTNYNSTPFVIDLLEESFKNAKKNLTKPYIIRHSVLSFYFVRDTKKILTVIANSKKYFNNLEDFLSNCTCLFTKIQVRMYCSKSKWCLVLNSVYKDKKLLISKYL